MQRWRDTLVDYNSRIKNEQLDKLFEAVLKLDNMEECYKFFEDVCTIKELESIGQRLEVAKQLTTNNTYAEIEESTGASTATISRVNRSLKYGAGGYKIILEKLGLLDKKE